MSTVVIVTSQDRDFGRAVESLEDRVRRLVSRGWSVVSHTHVVQPETILSKERHYFTAILVS